MEPNRSRVVQWCREYPATAICVAVCLLLYGLTAYSHYRQSYGWNEAQRQWGGVTAQLWTRVGQPDHAIDLDLVGPLDLWDGQWWRILAAVFHHGSLLHLVLNLSTAGLLGSLAEERIGSFRTLLLTLTSGPISLLPEFLAGGVALGYSGVLCAQFGLLLMLRRSDPILQEILSEPVVNFGLLSLIAGIPLTMMEILPIANLAHFSGLGYGVLIGWLLERPVPLSRRQWGAFVLAHVVIIPLWGMACHPYWRGAYHWHRSKETRDPQLQSSALQRAVELDPQLKGAWMELAGLFWKNNDKVAAWGIGLRGLAHNPTDGELLELLRQIWWTWGDQQRESAIVNDELDRVFGDHAQVLRDQLRQRPKRGIVRQRIPRGPATADELAEAMLDDGVQQQGNEFDFSWPMLIKPRQEEGLGMPAPDDPWGAAEGRQL